MTRSLANIDLAEFLRPKPRAERVNSHVTVVVREPTPDFEAMRRLVSTPVSVRGFPDVEPAHRPAEPAEKRR